MTAPYLPEGHDSGYIAQPNLPSLQNRAEIDQYVDTYQRLRRMRISFQFMHTLLNTRGRWWRVVADLPDDVVVRGLYRDPDHEGFIVWLWHPTFDVVPENGLIPMIDASSFSIEVQGDT